MTIGSPSAASMIWTSFPECPTASHDRVTSVPVPLKESDRRTVRGAVAPSEHYAVKIEAPEHAPHSEYQPWSNRVGPGAGSSLPTAPTEIGRPSTAKSE